MYATIDLAQRVLRSTWLLGVLVGLCSWSSLALIPSYTIDSSWMLGLQMGLAQDLHFGSELFTYGPLGLLEVPVATRPASHLLRAAPSTQPTIGSIEITSR